MEKVRIGTCFSFKGLLKSLRLYDLDIVSFDSFAQWEEGEMTCTSAGKTSHSRYVLTRCFAVTPKGHRLLRKIGGIKAKTNPVGAKVPCFVFFISQRDVLEKLQEAELAEELQEEIIEEIQKIRAMPGMREAMLKAIRKIRKEFSSSR